jgi:hypothetical protein
MVEWPVCHWRYKGWKKSLEENENENTIYQNLWDTAKTVLRGKNIAMGVYIKKNKEIKRQISNK